MRKRRWSAAEVGMLWPRYLEEGPAALARELGRSEDSVASQAARLGLWSQQQHRRRANTRAERNRSVNVHFFHTPGPVVAAVLGYLWARGGVRTTPRHVLSLRCPRPGEPVLLAVRSALGSRHHVRRRRGHTVVEVCSRPLVTDLLQNFGPPPGRSNPDPPLPPIPAGLLPDF